MTLNGARKAALLLASLDSGTAAELLKGAEHDMVTEIVAEMAYIKTSGEESGSVRELVDEFAAMLRRSDDAPQGEQYVEQLLGDVLGQDQARSAMGKVQHLMERKDPFMFLRSAGVNAIAAALDGESPQVAALVMAELPAGKSAKLLPMLPDEIRSDVIRGMTGANKVSSEAKVRVASMIRSRMEVKRESGEVATTTTDSSRDVQLRKVAVLLREQNQEFRDSMINAVAEQDQETADLVRKMMVMWEDLPVIGERALQEAFRGVDSRQLALAMVGADETVVEKVRSNISERAAAMLDEESSLLSKPKGEEIETARETILESLRELNAAGSLDFEEN